MEWFGGSTAEAVQKVQREGSVLLVYVKDGSEGSQQTDATFTDTQRERQKEIERRQMGKAVAEQQKQRDEAERRKIAEDIKKQREEEKAARERIRAQIADDRRNRFAGQEPLRPNQDAGQQQSTPTVRPASERPAASSANILYRLADGSTLRQQYPAETTLSEARDQLVGAVPGLGDGIRLLSGFPPQPFTPDQFSQSLAQLGLTPTGTIIVKPPRGTSTSLQPPMTAQWLFDLVMLPFSLLPLFLNPFYYMGLYRPPQRSNSGPREPPAKRARTEGPRQGASERGQGNIPRSAAVRRVRGNVHGLGAEGEGDDDRTETWNGNSTTQQ